MYEVPVVPTATRLGELGKNRLYGFWIYGGTLDKKFDEDRTTASSSTAHTAKKFDELRITDRSTTDTATVAGDLANVTNAQCLVNGNCNMAGSGSDGQGWMLEYSDGLNYRTATGAAVLSSCTMWSELHPVVSGDTACSNTIAVSASTPATT
jgi:type IV pilus assembly protein PilY1